MATMSRSSGRNVFRTSLWMTIVMSALGIALMSGVVPFVSGQQFAIFAPPATPVTTEVFSGPPPAPANLEARPLPGTPAEALGGQIWSISNTPPDGVFPSIPLPANMLGLSLELSVANDFVGDKVGEPAYQLLNYLNAIRLRAGRGPIVRIGGNTQDTAIYDTSFTGVITKTGGGMANGIPITPSIVYGNVIFELIEQITTAIDAEFIWGVNMVNNTAPFTVPMVKEVRAVLGDSLKFYLVGNEPDRYAMTGKRNADYSLEQYIAEWGDLTDRVAQADYSDNPKQFAAPSVCCTWTTMQVLNAGMLANYADRLKVVTAIQYPQSLCGNPDPYGHDGYMSMNNIRNFAMYDQDAVNTATSMNLPYYLVETNTASCIGVADVSDTFTSAMWSVNAALQLGWRNHSGVLLHSGGQNTLYNLVTPPAYNASNRIVSAKAWRTGPIFYSTLVVAEALRPSDGQAAVTVTDQQFASDAAAVYNIYENGVIARQAFINMVNDPTGANNFEVGIPTPPNNPASIPYKLMLAPTLAEKDNITWAGQTFGYWSEGILKGEETILQAPCANGQCTLTVPAPGVALAFVNQAAQGEASITSSAYHPQGTQNPQVVLESNGDRGRRGGATSRGSVKSAALPGLNVHKSAHFALAAGAFVAFACLFA